MAQPPDRLICGHADKIAPLSNLVGRRVHSCFYACMGKWVNIGYCIHRGCPVAFVGNEEKEEI